MWLTHGLPPEEVAVCTVISADNKKDSSGKGEHLWEECIVSLKLQLTDERQKKIKGQELYTW